MARRAARVPSGALVNVPGVKLTGTSSGASVNARSAVTASWSESSSWLY